LTSAAPAYRNALAALLASDDLREQTSRREPHRRCARLGDDVVEVAERVGTPWSRRADRAGSRRIAERPSTAPAGGSIEAPKPLVAGTACLKRAGEAAYRPRGNTAEDGVRCRLGSSVASGSVTLVVARAGSMTPVPQEMEV
jgi:hypothetical protein